MLWSPVYLKRRLSRPLPTKNGGILSTVKDVRTYVLALPDSPDPSAYWQRACQLLLDQADVEALSQRKLRGLAEKTKDGPQARRLLALAATYDGATRTEAAMIGGAGLQIIRDWVLHFNERGPDGLLERNRHPTGPCLPGSKANPCLEPPSLPAAGWTRRAAGPMRGLSVAPKPANALSPFG